MNYNILIADDKEHVLSSFRDKLKTCLDIIPTFENNPKDVIKRVKESPFLFAVIVLDYHFENSSLTGAGLAKELFEINPKLIILICTGDSSAETPIECLRAGVTDYIKKNNDLSESILKIRNYCKKFDETSRVVVRRQVANSKHLSNEANIKEIGMVGWSDALNKVSDDVQQLSKKGSLDPVLIRGESGTGKELVARSIHRLSDRANHQFVEINCGAICENLLESELFGHEKGAFTGAVSKKIGKFQIAHRGTIFLDEIGDMPSRLQVKLLRVLQEGTFSPVGSGESIKVDVRIISATHVNLEQAIEDDTFREDLYYRLNGIPINIPPLRERVADIEPLVLHIQDKNKTSDDKKIQYKTLKYLKGYKWQGNVRELENEVSRLLTMINEPEITPDHLDPKFFESNLEDIESSYPEFKKRLDNQVLEKEKEYILRRVQGADSIRDAAKRISMSKSSLYTKITSWGLTFDEVL